MNKTFGKFQYKEAKELLAEKGVPRIINGVSEFITPSFTRRYWTIEGTPYTEVESHLEFPEDDYRLVPVK